MMKNKRWLAVIVLNLLIAAGAIFLMSKHNNSREKMAIENGENRTRALQRTEPPALTAVVPHHDLVKKQRLNFWEELKTKSPNTAARIDRIIVVAPNHFGSNQNIVVADENNWELQNGTLENWLASSSATPKEIARDTYSVKSDHGIINLVAELHHNFPHADFAPFLLGTKMEFEKLQNLLDFFEKACENKTCLLVASADFSHYLPLEIADYQDAQTLDKLQKQNITAPETLNQATYSAMYRDLSPPDAPVAVDSPQSLYVLQEFAKKHNLNNFWLQNHTNSAFGNPETMETTSHFFGAYWP